jgi:triacylglycerol lipase
MPDSPSGYDNALALKLAGACQLAYTQLDHPDQFAAPPGYQIQAQFDADVLGHQEPIGFLMSSDTDAILAFRGTDNFQDGIADIRAHQVAYPFDASAGMSHAGFTGIYQSARDAVRAAVAALPPGLTLYVTGHSLGGALAELAVLDIAVNTAFQSPIMYTLASPRAGDPDFANRFDNVVVTNNTSSWRIVNMGDLVPLLPPEKIIDVLRFKTFFYQHPADVLLIDFRKGTARANHALDNYIAALQ